MPAARFRIVIAETAAADLDEIEAYWIAQGEVWRAERYYRDLVGAADRELSDGRLPGEAGHLKFPGIPMPGRFWPSVFIALFTESTKSPAS